MKDGKRHSHSFDRVAMQKLLSLHRKSKNSRHEICQIDALHSLSMINIQDSMGPDAQTNRAAEQ